MNTDPVQEAAAHARASLHTFITERGGTETTYGWASWAGYLAEALRSLLQAIPVPPVDVDPAELNDITHEGDDPGLCNLPIPGGTCERLAGHSGGHRFHTAAECGPGRCTCGATVDAEGNVHMAGAS